MKAALSTRRALTIIGHEETAAHIHVPRAARKGLAWPRVAYKKIKGEGMVSAAAEYEHKGVAAAATPMPYASVTRMAPWPLAIVFGFALPMSRIGATAGSRVLDRSSAAAIL